MRGLKQTDRLEKTVIRSRARAAFLSRCLLGCVLITAAGGSASAQSVQAPVSDPSVEAQLSSFRLHEDLEINLFADESHGIANPIAIHWDSRGRLWVLTTLAYAQLAPGETPNDKILILEDTDGDGRADSTKVFAEGLDMPTGFALGLGGVYVGEGADLVFLRDSNNDDQADAREIVLTGFGFGDTHQNISNLTWGPDGRLYFTQGLHTFSRVETPWGIVRGDTAGFWRFDPARLRLEPFGFPSLVSQNPCGVVFDKWGNLFIKSNNRELIFSTPALIPSTHSLNLVPIASIGATPGKSMGGEYVESRHLPDWLQHHLLIAGYYSHRVSAFPLVEDGAGFARVEPVELLASDHESFRPVDIRVGPDGAIYVADWFNPIIGHYQASLRHPDRDKDHGRIWRLTAKNRDLVPLPSFGSQPLELAEHLKSDEKFVRDQATRRLIDLGAEDGKVAAALLKWIRDGGAESSPEALIAIAGILESLSAISPALPDGSGNPGDPLLSLHDQLRQHEIPQVRAFAAAMIGRQPAAFSPSDPSPEGTESVNLKVFPDDLRKIGSDEPAAASSVVLHAITSCAQLPQADALPLALQALDAGSDRFIDYALRQTVHALKDQWLPAVKSGQLEFSQPSHLAFALETLGGPEAITIAREKLSQPDLEPPLRQRFAAVLAKVGTPEDLRDLLELPQQDASVLEALIEAHGKNRRRPAAPFLPRLTQLVTEADSREIREAAITLAGQWKATPLAPVLSEIAHDAGQASRLRAAALISLALLTPDQLVSQLPALAKSPNEDWTVRLGALDALSRIDLGKAAETSASLLMQPSAEGETTTRGLLLPILIREGGSQALAGALTKTELSRDQAVDLIAALSEMGRSDPELSGVFNRALGVTPGALPYSIDFVEKLATEVQASGDPRQGKDIYERAQLTCIACHQIGGVGGVLGPNLDTVGAGLPIELVIESVLWPDRQLKEGYFAISVTTRSGEVLTGYEEKEAEGMLWLKDTASGTKRGIAPGQIAKRKNIGTLMPAGLTNSLSRAELRDLIAYLVSLRGEQKTR